MKYKIFTFFLLFAVCFTSSAFAQKKTTEAISVLLESEFIKKFQEMNMSATASAMAFKSSQENYSREDQMRVEKAYNTTAKQFNFILLNLKNDLLNKKKLKFMIDFPEDYQKQLELDMYKLSDFYATNYQQVLADVTQNQVDGAGPFLLIAALINSSSGILALVKDIVEFSSYRKQLKRQFNEQDLQKRLVEPHLFPTWQELGRNEDNNYNNYNSNGGIGNGGYPPIKPQSESRFEPNFNPDFSKPNRGIADRDGDNVADSEDACPDVYGSARGCPDTDGDGVADKFDKCINEYGFSSNNGCPITDDNQNQSQNQNQNQGELDSDGDGISDNFDNCAFVAGPASNNGCPIDESNLDSDADGVPDISDNCVFLAGPASNNGCPVESVTTKAKVDKLKVVIPSKPKTKPDN